MRKSIFTRAWELVKTLGLDLSLALRNAWLEFKLEKVFSRINELELKLNTDDVREELKMLMPIARELNIALNSIKPVIKVEFNNSGAEAYYNCGLFNND
jgi:hypothetical protein